KEQQFNRQQDRGDRRGKDGGHSSGGTCYQKCLSFRRREMKELREDGSNCSTRHDNWAFGTEGPASADGYRRGQRLKHGDFRLHAATTKEDGFEGLRKSVAKNFLGNKKDQKTQ